MRNVRRRPFLRHLIWAPLIATACGDGSVAVPRPSVTPAAPAAGRPTVPSVGSTSAAALPLVVFLGDSLTAGLGVDADQAFPALVVQSLADRGCAVRLVNAGVSGDTTAGGRSRVDWVLSQKPAVLVVELGANDALRGQPLESIESNLREIVRRAKAAGARVLVAGMQMPPSYGPEYSAGFAAIFERVSREESVALMPFLLEGVGGDPALNQGDGIHPTPDGHRHIARRVEPFLAPLLGC